jgi:glucose/arabinose dehydrogenase
MLRRLQAAGVSVIIKTVYLPTLPAHPSLRLFDFLGAFFMRQLSSCWALLLICALTTMAQAADPKLKLEKDDHICIVGNTLGERLQHDGWLEAVIYSRHPQLDLVIRNLAYSADEIDGWKNFSSRLRSKSFGSHDEWLAGSAPCPRGDQKDVDANRFEKANTNADVIFAFFGYNESFAGEKGLDAFKQRTEEFIKHTLEQKYNGTSAPKLVLFSPTAHQDLKDPNLPDGSENNTRLAMYTKAMGEVAAKHNVAFVDLFTPTQKLFADGTAYTINGVHLNEAGNEAIAKIISNDLFGEAAIDADLVAKLRPAVNDKAEQWYLRYRTTDGFSVYGDRAFLAFTDGQTNYTVTQRELKILDEMTQNRDKVIWAVAQGQTAKVDDSNTSPFIEVKTNKPGSGPNGEHVYLDGEEAMKRFKLGAGIKAQLFASEKEFPELVSPVQMAWDTKGRLWVAVWPSYPHAKPRQPMHDKLLIFEDTNNDGKADVCKTFSDDLHNPTGFEFWNGGVIVAEGPNVLFLKDTDGDDKYDVKERLIHGIDTADTHHTANSFVLDPGGALYMQEGTFHHSQIETPYGPPQRVANGAVFRYEPRTQKFEVYVSYGFANPHGHAFDRWGQNFVTDGTGAQTYLGAGFSGQVDFPHKHGGMRTVYQQRTRPCPATEILGSEHFPEEFQGNLLVGNVIGFQGILRYKMSDKDSGFLAEELEPLVYSDDPNFRPSDLEMAPDGSLYFIDWQNVIIGHMQHNLRDPSRDHQHGRIYRLTYEGRPLAEPAKIAGEPVEKLLELLKSNEDRVRYRARIELGGRPTAEVMTALASWMSGLDASDPDYEHHVLEGLWLHQNHNVVNEELLKKVLNSPDFRARAAATRVLCYWRDQVDSPLTLLQERVNDENHRVRLEAVRALSFFDSDQALEVAVESLIHPQDDYLAYVLKETMNTLERRAKARK